MQPDFKIDKGEEGWRSGGGGGLGGREGLDPIGVGLRISIISLENSFYGTSSSLLKIFYKY